MSPFRPRGGGHLYQGRFKCFPVQEDRHFLLVCRYVEANPVRAKLVEKASEWRWGSLCQRTAAKKTLPLGAWPVERPGNWAWLVNRGLNAEQLEAVRLSVDRGRPLGEEQWVRKTARRLGLENTLRKPGRPKKETGAGEERGNQ